MEHHEETGSALFLEEKSIPFHLGITVVEFVRKYIQEKNWKPFA
jgi:hypothetical protein